MAEMIGQARAQVQALATERAGAHVSQSAQNTHAQALAYTQAQVQALVFAQEIAVRQLQVLLQGLQAAVQAPME